MDFECPICFSDCDNSWFVTKCGHLFHQNCLYTSISYENVCPICRIEIDQDSINPLYPHSYKKGKVNNKYSLRFICPFLQNYFNVKKIHFLKKLDNSSIKSY